jgi:origin recognition complex subunit 1
MPRRPASSRNDQDDDLSDEWEWIYSSAPSPSGRSRHDSTTGHIVGARNGDFECHVGDCVLLQADGANHVWAAIINDFVESDDDGDMAADFLWLSSESEIRNGPRKRSDFLPVRVFSLPVSGYRQ